MLRVPAVAAAVVIGKRRLQSLEGHVRRAHNGLPQVCEAVDHVPVVIFGQFVIGLEARVCLHDSELQEGEVSHTSLFHRLWEEGDDGDELPDSAAGV